MNEQLESNLRVALRERARLVPGASAERLTGRDYHPRHSRLRPPVAIGATAIAAAAAGAATLVISLGAGATSAFAGWTAKPTLAAPGQVQAALASCAAAQSPVAGLPLKLSDTRGPFTFSVYADGQTSATCIKGPSFKAESNSMSSGPVSVSGGQIMFSSAHQPARPGQAYSFADGRTGAGVTGVTLVLDDGTTVQATVGGGWFVAWWPGDNAVKSAQITTPTGVKTQTVNTPSVLPPANGRGSSGASGSAPSGPPAGAPAVSGSSNSSSGSGGGESQQSLSTSR